MQSETMEQNIQYNLLESLKKKEIMWRSKSWVNWHTSANLNTKYFQMVTIIRKKRNCVNLNTKYFHMATIIRRRRNCIEGLKTDDGRWLNCWEDISNHIVSTFTNIFTSAVPSFIQDIASLNPSITPILCLFPKNRIPPFLLTLDQSVFAIFFTRWFLKF